MEQETLWSKVKAFALGWVAPILGLLAWVYFLIQGKRKAEDELAIALEKSKEGKEQDVAQTEETKAVQAVQEASSVTDDYAKLRDQYIAEHGSGGGVPAGDQSVRPGPGGEGQSSDGTGTGP